MLPVVMEAVRVPRLGGGRARTRQEAVMGDKTYSSRANRSLLRGRGIKAVIPEPSDQIRHRKRMGSRGGRPVNFDSETYKGRNTIERSFSLFKTMARHRNSLRQTCTNLESTAHTGFSPSNDFLASFR